jgi:hypothetical protein
MSTKQWLDLVISKAPWEIPGPAPSIPAPKLPAPKCPVTQVTHATPGVSSTDPMPQTVFQDTQVAGVKAATLQIFISDNKYFVQFPGQTTFTELNPSAVKDFNLPPLGTTGPPVLQATADVEVPPAEVKQETQDDGGHSKDSTEEEIMQTQVRPQEEEVTQPTETFDDLLSGMD